jgi:hypothetical protein
MNKKIANALLIIAAAWIMFGLGIIVNKQFAKPHEITKTDTIVTCKRDTIVVNPKDKVVYRYIKDTISLKVRVHDTLIKIVSLPRQYLIYKDASYRAVVSGVDPRLDSLQIYRKTITKVVTNTIVKNKKPKPWGLSLQAGYGWDGNKFTPYVGAGISYSVIRW